MRTRGGEVCTAPDPATFLHSAESLADNSLPTEPANSHCPWYHGDSQVHKTFISPFEFTVFRKPFPVHPDQKEAAWGVFQFQILCDSPVWSVGFIRKLAGSASPTWWRRCRLRRPSRGARGRQAGRGRFFCGWFSVFLSEPGALELVDSAILL